MFSKLQKNTQKPELVLPQPMAIACLVVNCASVFKQAGKINRLN